MSSSSHKPRSAAELSNVTHIDDPATLRRRHTLTTESLTEASIAERFARLHGDDFRFDHRRRRRLVWSGHRWTPDVDGAVVRLALDFAREWQLQAVDGIDDLDKRQRVLSAAVRLERRDSLHSLLAFAQDLKPIADAGDAWDLDPWMLGVPNGVLDLKSGSLRPGRRNDRISMCTGVKYDAEAKCPRWVRFINEVFGGDVDLGNFVQRALGYSLTGDTSEQCLFLTLGDGANGKSTLLATVQAVLGDYAHVLPFSALEMKGRSPIPNDIAGLVGRRFAMASETQDGARLNESRVKALTGSDPIPARFLHAEFFTFVPVSKFWLAVNHPPVVSDDSHGFWRRVRLIPFAQRFEINKSLAAELHREAAGILQWTVAGCLAWQQRGLDAPAAVAEATRAYQSTADDLADFLAEAVDVMNEVETGARDLFQHYVGWARQRDRAGDEPMSETAFGRRVGQRFAKRKIGGVAVYKGLRPRGRS